MRIPSLILFATLGFFFFMGFGLDHNPKKKPATPSLPSRQELRRSLYNDRRMQIVYSSGDDLTRRAYQRFYAGAGFHWLQAEPIPDREYPLDSLGTMSMQLTGSLQTNRVLQRLLPDLPIEVVKRGFRFLGKTYHDSTDVLYLFFPNPRNPRKQLRITTGNSDRAILDFLQQPEGRFGNFGDFWLARDGQIRLVGFFVDTGPQAWRPEAARRFELDKDRKAVIRTENFEVFTHGRKFNKQDLTAFAEQEQDQLGHLAQSLQIPKERLAQLPRLGLHLWDSFESKAILTRHAGLRHVDVQRNEVHILWNHHVRGDDFFAEAQWFVAKLLGPTKSAAMREGLAVALTRDWRGVGFKPWAARLLKTGNYVAIEELFEPEIYRAEPPLTRQPLLGALAEFLLQRYSAAEFADLYRKWPESGIPARFPRGDTWESLKRLCYDAVIRIPPAPKRFSRVPAITPQQFRRGFCYAHEGYQVHNGYMGSRSLEALQKLATMGVNAISVSPFGYLRDPHQPGFIRRSDRVGSENDASLLAALQWARALGMRVMLKPHILMSGPHWGWPGIVEMSSAEDWKTFFDRYERWMRHYAMLAEIYGFDSLCIGVELVKTTLGHQAEWRDMIRRLRGLYSGPMLYAANWGEEFETLELWNELDVIAINCYYPLSSHEAPSDSELVAGMSTIVDKIEAVAAKHRKPVLITELGFASQKNAWQQPHDAGRRSPVDLRAQKRCYEAAFQSLWGKPWLAGMYWWKWPTDLDDGGPSDNQFTPNGKPAEQVVAKWYQQTLDSQSDLGQ